MASHNLMIAQRYLYEMWTLGRLDIAEQLVAPDGALRDPMVGLATGPDQVQAAAREMREAFPDLAYTIKEIIADAGDQIAVRWSMRGTHRGALMTIPPTERSFALSGVLLLRIEGDRLSAMTCCWEPCDMLQQLGLLAGPDGASDRHQARPEHATPGPAPAIRGPAPRAEVPLAAMAARDRDGTASLMDAARVPPPSESDLDAQWTL